MTNTDLRCQREYKQLFDRLLHPDFVAEIRKIIANARENSVRAIDHQRVLMYWHIGQRIFEEEQQGKDRAEYGKYLIRNLAQQPEPEFGSSFSFRNLNRYRQFSKNLNGKT